MDLAEVMTGVVKFGVAAVVCISSDSSNTKQSSSSPSILSRDGGMVSSVKSISAGWLSSSEYENGVDMMDDAGGFEDIDSGWGCDSVTEFTSADSAGADVEVEDTVAEPEIMDKIN